MRHLIILTIACSTAFAAQAETISLRSDVKRAPVYPPTAPATPAATVPAAVVAPATPAAAVPAAVIAPATPAVPAPAVAAAPNAVANPTTTNSGVAGLLPRVSPLPMTVLSTTPPTAPVTPAPAVAAAPAADNAAKDAAPALVEVGYDPKVKRDPRGKAIIQNNTGAVKNGGQPSARNSAYNETRHASLSHLTPYDEKTLLKRSHVKTGRTAVAQHMHGVSHATRLPRGSGMRWSA